MEAEAKSPSNRQLASLWEISIEIAMLHEVPVVLRRVLDHCLDLTGSEFGFVGLTDAAGQMMEVAAIRGFEPTDPTFFERFRMIPVRPNLFGVALRERRTSISDDVPNDPIRIGQPRGHPPVRTFLGVPLGVGEKVIGMIGVANRPGGYSADDDQLLTTFANQAAVAIENARLIAYQQDLIATLETLNRELSRAEHEQVLEEERRRLAERVREQVEQAIFDIGQRVNLVLDNPNLAPDDADDLREARQIAAKAGAEATESGLNKRQVEILGLLAQGLSNREIAGRVHLSQNTIKSHVQAIFNKLSVRNRTEAAISATNRKLI